LISRSQGAQTHSSCGGEQLLGEPRAAAFSTSMDEDATGHSSVG